MGYLITSSQHPCRAGVIIIIITLFSHFIDGKPRFRKIKLFAGGSTNRRKQAGQSPCSNTSQHSTCRLYFLRWQFIKHFFRPLPIWASRWSWGMCLSRSLNHELCEDHLCNPGPQFEGLRVCRVDGRMDTLVGGWVDRWVDGWMVGWKNGSMDKMIRQMKQ